MILMALMVAAALPAAGPARDACPAQNICATDMSSIVRGLQAAGYKAVVTESNGKPYLVSATNGQDFAIDLYNCDDEVRKTGCRTLLFNSFYPPQPYLTVAVANRFNKTAMFGRAYIGDGGRLEFQMPFATDGGVSPVQFKAWIAWYTAADADLDKIVTEAEAAAPKPK